MVKVPPYIILFSVLLFKMSANLPGHKSTFIKNGRKLTFIQIGRMSTLFKMGASLPGVQVYFYYKWAQVYFT